MWNRTHTFINARARLRPTSSRSLTLPSILSDRQIAVRRSSAGGNYNPKIQRCRKIIERERDNSAGDYRETIIRPTLSSNSNATQSRDNRIRSMKRACLFDPNFRSTSARDFTRSRDEREGTSGKAISVKLRTNTAVATSSNAATLARNCVVRSAVKRL